MTLRDNAVLLRERKVRHAGWWRLPLTALQPSPARGPGPAGNRTRLRRAWRSWAGPAAAAVSVVLLVGLVVAVTGGLRTTGGPGHGQATASASHPGLPGYFASFSGSSSLSQYVVVRSTLTGAVTARVATPEAPPHEQLADDALAAAPDDHTFYVEYNTIPVTVSSQIRIYAFSITSSGSATPMTPVKGGTFVGRSQIAAGSLAVSPDGSELALTADRSLQPSAYADFSDQIVVIDLRNGARSTWQGGLDRPGRSLSIADLSWAPDGRSLVFLAQWCASALDACTGGPAPGNYRDAQARSLRVASGGGALDQGPVLLRTSARYPVIVQAFAGPDGGDLTALVLSGPVSTLTDQTRQVAVERISAATGSVLGTEYRTLYRLIVSLAFGGGKAALIWISPDPAGRYLLFSYDNGYGFYTGWLSQGELHPLPVEEPDSGPAW
jgi:hypothetical protein